MINTDIKGEASKMLDLGFRESWLEEVGKLKPVKKEKSNKSFSFIVSKGRVINQLAVGTLLRAQKVVSEINLANGVSYNGNYTLTELTEKLLILLHISERKGFNLGEKLNEILISKINNLMESDNAKS